MQSNNHHPSGVDDELLLRNALGGRKRTFSCELHVKRLSTTVTSVPCLFRAQSGLLLRMYRSSRARRVDWKSWSFDFVADESVAKDVKPRSIARECCVDWNLVSQSIYSFRVSLDRIILILEGQKTSTCHPCGPLILKEPVLWGYLLL